MSGFAHLLGDKEDPSKGDDASEGMPRSDAFSKNGKHAAMKDFAAAVSSGDHEGASAALEDWHALHEASGPDASFDPKDTEPT